MKIFEPKLPEYALDEIEKCLFEKGCCGKKTRRCTVDIDEKDAVTIIDPESFAYSDVYGKCEILQVVLSNHIYTLISKFEFEKNYRSWESEIDRRMNNGESPIPQE